MTRKRRASGFTLVELLVVVTIIIILSSMIVPRFLKYADKARVARAREELVGFKSVMDSYILEKGHLWIGELNPDNPDEYYNELFDPYYVFGSAGISWVEYDYGSPDPWGRPYSLEERSLSLPFRGSKNQRIIDVQKSLRVGRVVLADRFIREKESTAVYRDKFYGVVV